jgi:hypothetical protein
MQEGSAEDAIALVEDYGFDTADEMAIIVAIETLAANAEA